MKAAVVVPCVWLVLCCSTGAAPPTYTIVPLGFDDLEHTRDDGYTSSTAGYLNGAGQVAGTSVRWNGASYVPGQTTVSDLGQTAWFYDGTTTIKIGLVGNENTRSDGYNFSSLYGLTETGSVIGASYRYSGTSYLGENVWVYDGTATIDVGPAGSEYTHSSGYEFSRLIELNEAGQIAGQANRYGGSLGLGQSAWLYDGATTVVVGLTGAEHTRNDGFKSSTIVEADPPRFLNEAGQIIGYSARFNGGSTDLGRSAWLYDGATSTDVGLIGPGHTRNDGYKWSAASHLNEGGQVAGRSKRYNGGSADLGYSAWFYDGATTVDVGLTDSEHTSSAGYKSSRVDSLNEAGQFGGVSERYNGGSTFLGTSAWLYNGAATVRIGFTGPEFTAADGTQENAFKTLNEAGQVSGFSNRFNGGNDRFGRTAWLYNGDTTIDIGLVGSEHTRSDGYKYSTTGYQSDLYGELNEAGEVIGYSERFNGGSTYLGQSAWLYDGTTTIDIGLVGPEHTRADGYKFSFAQTSLWVAGRIVGYSERYNGESFISGSLGRSAWLYDGTTTVELGFTGGEYTRSSGYESTGVSFLNEAGQVVGASARYDGGSTELGQDAWLYDPLLHQTFLLQVSKRSDGYAYSDVEYLGDDGLALGHYTLFDAQDNDLGERAFYFRSPLVCTTSAHWSMVGWRPSAGSPWPQRFVPTVLVRLSAAPSSRPKWAAAKWPICSRPYPRAI